MEIPSLPNVEISIDEKKALEAQLRECFGRVAYSHKTHEKCADIFHSRLGILKLIQILLAAVTTGGLIVTLFGEGNLSTVLAAISATLLLAINTYTKEHDLGELSAKYSNTAGDLWDIRESYLSLLTDLRCADCDLNMIRNKRDELQGTLKNVYQAAPRTISKGYKFAQSALKVDEELTFSDEEIDNMLPGFLRKTE